MADIEKIVDVTVSYVTETSRIERKIGGSRELAYFSEELDHLLAKGPVGVQIRTPDGEEVTYPVEDIQVTIRPK
jgi:hypothetical protein